VVSWQSTQKPSRWPTFRQSHAHERTRHRVLPDMEWIRSW
jgi:ribosomal protein L28